MSSRAEAGAVVVDAAAEAFHAVAEEEVFRGRLEAEVFRGLRAAEVVSAGVEVTPDPREEGVSAAGVTRAPREEAAFHVPRAVCPVLPVAGSLHLQRSAQRVAAAVPQPASCHREIGLVPVREIGLRSFHPIAPAEVGWPIGPAQGIDPGMAIFLARAAIGLRSFRPIAPVQAIAPVRGIDPRNFPAPGPAPEIGPASAIAQERDNVHRGLRIGPIGEIATKAVTTNGSSE